MTEMFLKTVFNPNQPINESDFSFNTFLQLLEAMKGNTVRNGELVENLTRDPDASHMKLLQDLRFRIKPAKIKAPYELPPYTDAIYWVLTALC